MAAMAGTILLLLVGETLSSLDQISRGCKRWRSGAQPHGDVCCDECHPGNRLVSHCGANPQDLCTPCEGKTYTQNPKNYKCSRCTQCEGAQVLVEDCTPTTDTRCGCKKGLLCGNDRCSFCLKKCGKGEEPSENRSCRPCANGTFNDQIHQKCKPWRTKCPNPDQIILASGDAFTDNRCVDVSPSSLKQPESDRTKSSWPLLLSVLPSVCLLALCIFLILTVYGLKRKKKTRDKTTNAPIITTATDDPETLIPMECSFHEAQEEHGNSSSESLVSKESQDHLVA
ncbi:tumor necrosis factor receptor superfamily member 9-like [Phyllopteryx taeniolatus]|uniref:tumor necrosis factor receptor superfamily member 9-like n=1 Tax=Phyllopteryx taeniolatus TaxID=161469 RepID=UPI002AD28EE9|nr:tumor necrosis factor receptor superfamily member 9-like [Phyllopteryx taeniolatus]